MTTIVKTQSGKIKGYTSKGLQIFKGIPYAAPPIGPLRFSPPAPKDPWDGVLDATKFGPYASQGYSVLQDLLGRATNQSEADCLTLNVWTPAIDDAKRPVMVWIHGGAFVSGGAAMSVYDGSALANRGNIVVVTLNYRLGALGFAYIPGETANVGLFDQIAVLKWVKNNIEAFGGNPENVTIFGESAGGMSIVCLLAMPAAKGLFHHAIVQSGPISFDPKMGKKYTDRLMNELGIEVGDIKALREVPVKKIIKVQTKITLSVKFTEFLQFSPRIDGDTLPDPLEAVRAGSASDIDLIVGTNLDEMKLYSIIDPRARNATTEGLYKIMNSIMHFFGQDDAKTKQILKIYKDAREDQYSTAPNEILYVIGTDLIFRVPATRLAEVQRIHQSNTYNYLFTWPSPAFKGRLGSCHAVEIAFVFGTLDTPFMPEMCGKGPVVNEISEKMMDTWIAFARSGNPNHGSIPKWPPYDAEKRSTMLLGSELKLVNAIFEKERKAWDGII
ncbi:MAG: carboxylesterase/lipase family protein [Candidatus Helarchaeota archaeon]|nr:carboxylesterase/lipase family protein [Candidatus Helarchaeota archaeon]